MSVGISQISIVIPEYFISIEELAQKRKINPQKAIGGLKVKEARIPYNTTLVEMAKKAVERIDFKDVERFYFATESEGDASKPTIALKVLKEIGISKVTPFCLKFACLGGLQALLSACEYTFATEKPSIVIAVDRSIYKETDPWAEVTQGSAAVALRITINPKLLSLDYKEIGSFSSDIEDFKIPFSTFPFPKVQGKLSCVSYLYCLEKALENYKEKNEKTATELKRKDNLLETSKFIAFHTPFLYMTELVAALFYRKTVENNSSNERITLEDCLSSVELFDEYKKSLKKLRERNDFKKFFEEKIFSILNYHPRIGNSYNANVFIALLSALEKGKKGDQIGICGYGSGAGAIVLRGKIESAGFKSDLSAQINKGRKLSFSEYQKWRKNDILNLQ